MRAPSNWPEHVREVQDMGLACMGTEPDHGHISQVVLTQLAEAWKVDLNDTETIPNRG